ncbi:hypothetical protein A3G56_01455 [Candidatus Falkowbacteria bacterium RIFCSPLOWO2_12_FULL_45_10]|uniref:Uncharacterized protein n=2 Tax=Candidatus Falkowiibacteriota TaxID=1752728 RepID=A0A1F5RJX3_9BACT|nr:MAG: hypothetical protein A3D54_03845 [Candidatus Falkowbacteria bacterium RIFCSPHIGHO2_02_FULL_45_15]OGF19847.1 MAG: hypothetical protein A3G56_01455 [Candidatus Falkowbacteria bacterium RIFCSPLOWO2_12_FULL_45_10]
MGGLPAGECSEYRDELNKPFLLFSIHYFCLKIKTRIFCFSCLAGRRVILTLFCFYVFLFVKKKILIYNKIKLD